jgi:hypothetical protein
LHYDYSAAISSAAENNLNPSGADSGVECKGSPYGSSAAAAPMRCKSAVVIATAFLPNKTLIFILDIKAVFKQSTYTDTLNNPAHF